MSWGSTTAAERCGPAGAGGDLRSVRGPATATASSPRAWGCSEILGELGFSAEHAEVVARCVSDGDRNGKLTQGMGVFEIPVLMARTGPWT